MRNIQYNPGKLQLSPQKMRAVAEARTDGYGFRFAGIISLVVMTSLFYWESANAAPIGVLVFGALAIALQVGEQITWRWTKQAETRQAVVDRAGYGLAVLFCYFSAITAIPAQLWWSEGLLGQEFGLPSRCRPSAPYTAP